VKHYANAKGSPDVELDPDQTPNFGEALWSQPLSRPFGSSNKRELVTWTPETGPG